MTDHVYIVTESVQHGDTSIEGVFGDQDVAEEQTDEAVRECRFEEAERWSNEEDDDHVMSVRCLDVTYVARRHEVQ